MKDPDLELCQMLRELLDTIVCLAAVNKLTGCKKKKAKI